MSTTYRSGRGRLQPAPTNAGLAHEFEPEPSAEELDELEAGMRMRRRGPLGQLRSDPAALQSFDDVLLPETPPTDCAEPPEENAAAPERRDDYEMA